MPKKFAVAPSGTTALKIRDSDELFPVRRVYCMGRNYAEHAREMGHEPERETPFFFQKPSDAIYQSDIFPYPPGTNDVHHEVELMVLLKSGGCDIKATDALDHVFGYAVCLDMTRRDHQQEAKRTGRPWEIGKAFDYSGPCSEIVRVSEAGHPASGAISLYVNGMAAQHGNLDQQIWGAPEIIAYLSSLFELKAGDVIMTGTPAGIGPVAVGDRLNASIDGVGHLTVTVV